MFRWNPLDDILVQMCLRKMLLQSQNLSNILIVPKLADVILPHVTFLSTFKFQERKDGRENMRSLRDDVKNRLTDKCVNESGDSSGYESGAQTNRSLWRKQES